MCKSTIFHAFSNNIFLNFLIQVTLQWLRILSPIRKHTLSNKKPMARYKISPFKLLVQGITEITKTEQICVIFLGFPPEFNNEAILLNIPYTWVTEQRNQWRIYLEASSLLISFHSSRSCYEDFWGRIVSSNLNSTVNYTSGQPGNGYPLAQ